MLVRGRTWYLYVLVYLVGYRPTAVCAGIFFFDGNFDTPGAMPRCSVRNTYCMVNIPGMSFCWKLRCDTQQCRFFVLAGQFDGTEGNLRPSNAPQGVCEVHAPHTWGACYARAPLTNFLEYTAGQSTRHQKRNWKTGPAWISYSRIGAFYTMFCITTPELLVFLQVSACLSCCLFYYLLSVYHYYYSSGQCILLVHT